MGVRFYFYTILPRLSTRLDETSIPAKETNSPPTLSVQRSETRFRRKLTFILFPGFTQIVIIQFMYSRRNLSSGRGTACTPLASLYLFQNLVLKQFLTLGLHKLLGQETHQRTNMSHRRNCRRELDPETRAWNIRNRLRGCFLPNHPRRDQWRGPTSARGRNLLATQQTASDREWNLSLSGQQRHMREGSVNDQVRPETGSSRGDTQSVNMPMTQLWPAPPSPNIATARTAISGAPLALPFVFLSNNHVADCHSTWGPLVWPWAVVFEERTAGRAHVWP